MKKQDNAQYEALKLALSEGALDTLYVFHGAEHYLLEHYLGKVRETLISDGFGEFNYKRMESRGFSVSEFSAAVDALPVFAERTLIEVHDVDIFKLPESERTEMMSILSDLPEYVCVLFVYDTLEFKLDGRLKASAQFKKLANIVDFPLQSQTQLVKWIARHFKSSGKTISSPDAEYLAFITGGLMTTLKTEIEKIASYVSGDSVSRADIDKLVTPVPDAVSYKMTDAIIEKKPNEAMALLYDLFRMREPAHRLIFGLSLRLRQLLCAKICADNGVGLAEYMDICGIRHDFQARALMSSAKKATLGECKDAVLLCCKAAEGFNTGAGDPEQLMCDLVLRLSTRGRA